MTSEEAIKVLNAILDKSEYHYTFDCLMAIETAIDVLHLHKTENNPDELDCQNCIWQEYAIGNKCVPCRLNKCNCLSKNMYEEEEKYYD